MSIASSCAAARSWAWTSGTTAPNAAGARGLAEDGQAVTGAARWAAVGRRCCRRAAASTTVASTTGRLRLAGRDAARRLHRLQRRAFRLRRGARRGARPARPAAGRAQLFLARLRQPRRRVALPRAVRRAELPVRVLVNTALYDYCPEVVEAFRKRGDEIIGHGHTNSERQGGLDEADERALIAEATAAIAGARASAPAGLARSVDLGKPRHARPAGRGRLPLHARLVHGRPAGLACATRNGGRIWSVPYPQELNDIPMIVAREWTRPRFRRHDRRQLRRDAGAVRATRRW